MEMEMSKVCLGNTNYFSMAEVEYPKAKTCKNMMGPYFNSLEY